MEGGGAALQLLLQPGPLCRAQDVLRGRVPVVPCVLGGVGMGVERE